MQWIYKYNLHDQYSMQNEEETLWIPECIHHWRQHADF